MGDSMTPGHATVGGDGSSLSGQPTDAFLPHGMVEESADPPADELHYNDIADVDRLWGLATQLRGPFPRSSSRRKHPGPGRRPAQLLSARQWDRIATYDPDAAYAPPLGYGTAQPRGAGYVPPRGHGAVSSLRTVQEPNAQVEASTAAHLTGKATGTSLMNTAVRLLPEPERAVRSAEWGAELDVMTAGWLAILRFGLQLILASLRIRAGTWFSALTGRRR
jgi:hypothetical protein